MSVVLGQHSPLATGFIDRQNPVDHRTAGGPNPLPTAWGEEARGRSVAIVDQLNPLDNAFVRSSFFPFLGSLLGSIITMSTPPYLSLFGFFKQLLSSVAIARTAFCQAGF
jgi:hypothetical protein